MVDKRFNDEVKSVVTSHLKIDARQVLDELTRQPRGVEVALFWDEDIIDSVELPLLVS